MVYKRVAVCLVSLSVIDVTDMEGSPMSQIEELPSMPAGRIAPMRVMKKMELANEHKRHLRNESVKMAAKAEAITQGPADCAMEVAKDIMCKFGDGAQAEVDKVMKDPGVPPLTCATLD